MKFKKRYILILAVVLPAWLGSCRNYKAVFLEAKVNLPDTFYNATDTLNTVLLPTYAFFKDANLLKLIDSALAGNFDRQIAWQRIQMADAQLQYQKGARLPSADLNLSAGVEHFGNYTMNGVGNYDTNLSPNINSNQHIPNPTPDFFAGFRSAWEVDLWAKLKNQQKAALARLLASQSGYQLINTELAARIASLYYQLLALDTEADIIRKNIKLQENAVEIVQAQKLGGRATELAVQQFVAQLDRTRGLAFENAQQQTQAQSQLHLLTGRFDQAIARDTSLMALPLPIALHTGVPAQMLLNRPDIRQAELELTALNADIRSARAAFFPSLNLTAYAGYNAFASAVLFNPGSAVFGVIGGMTAPLLNRKKIKADYAYKIAEGKAALYHYQKTALTAYQEVTDHLQGMENHRRYYEWKAQEVQALQNALQAANDLYWVGRANYLEVITAQRSVLDAELELAVAKKNIYLSEVNLYRALGGGWR